MSPPVIGRGKERKLVETSPRVGKRKGSFKFSNTQDIRGGGRGFTRESYVTLTGRDYQKCERREGSGQNHTPPTMLWLGAARRDIFVLGDGGLGGSKVCSAQQTRTKACACRELAGEGKRERVKGEIAGKAAFERMSRVAAYS